MKNSRANIFLIYHSNFLFLFKTSVNKDTLFKNPNLLLEYGNIRERWLYWRQLSTYILRICHFYWQPKRPSQQAGDSSLKGRHNKRVTTVKITLTSSSVYVFDVFAVHHICQFSFVEDMSICIEQYPQLSSKIAQKPHMIFVRKRNKRLLKVAMFSWNWLIATTEITGLNCNLFSLKSLDVSRYKFLNDLNCINSLFSCLLFKRESKEVLIYCCPPSLSTKKV